MNVFKTQVSYKHYTSLKALAESKQREIDGLRKNANKKREALQSQVRMIGLVLAQYQAEQTAWLDFMQAN